MNRKTIMLYDKTVGSGEVKAGQDVSHLSRTERDVLVGLGWAHNVDSADAEDAAALAASESAARQAEADAKAAQALAENIEAQPKQVEPEPKKRK